MSVLRNVRLQFKHWVNRRRYRSNMDVMLSTLEKRLEWVSNAKRLPILLPRLPTDDSVRSLDKLNPVPYSRIRVLSLRGNGRGHRTV